MDATKPCNKHAPGTGCPARRGDHRNLAILGASEHCVATRPTWPSPWPCWTRPYGSPGRTASAASRWPSCTGCPATPRTSTPCCGRSRVSAYRKARDRASYAFAVGSVAAVEPLRDNAYKVTLIRNLVAATLARLTGATR